jgi:hypothetical protein
MTALTSIAACLALAAQSGTPAKRIGAGQTRSDPNVGKEVRTILLTDKQAARVHIVRVAPSYASTIQFPEPFRDQPICGDCAPRGAAGRGTDPALFVIAVNQQAHYLTIKPGLHAGDREHGAPGKDDFMTTVTVPLQSYTLTLQVEYTDDQARADPRIVFTMPDHSADNAYVRAQVANERKRLEDEMVKKIDDGVTAGFLRALMEPHSCNSLSNRDRNDDLVIEATELCTFGNRYFIRFQLENRRRAGADLSELMLKVGPDAKALNDAADTSQHMSTHHLEFRAIANGIVAFQLEDGQPRPRVFALEIHEQGGTGRNVAVTVKL